MGSATVSISAHANEMVAQSGNVVVGYWHNWCDGAGYRGGNAPCVDLTEVHPDYNVVNVSFMKVYNLNAGRIPTFELDPNIGLTESAFIDQINTLNSQGRSVLLALGGADAHVELKAGDEQAFADEVIRLTDKYGFDGLDIDLEQTAITAADNQTVIPAALRLVKDHYRAQGKNFMITMAPEFPYLTIANGKYLPYLEGLAGDYDFINPQFYNQGGDGVYVDGGVGWLSQNDARKEEFIYYISDSLINGTRGYTTITHDKLVFGIPANIDGANNGFVEDPNTLYAAFDRLKAQGQPLRGVMTWSVNWDMGKNSAGQAYNEKFIKDYGSYIHNQQPPEPDKSPVFTGIADTQVVRGTAFDPMTGITAADYNGNDISAGIQVTGNVDTNIVGDYALTYSVTDNAGNSANQARKVTVYDDSQPVCPNAWDSAATYVANDEVTHNGKLWRAKWWTKGEEPGTTGQWGVWEEKGPASCQ
ncbi:immunoglobulin-like domain-containing protein [Photobacterium rosenbergii]